MSSQLNPITDSVDDEIEFVEFEPAPTEPRPESVANAAPAWFKPREAAESNLETEAAAESVLPSLDVHPEQSPVAPKSPRKSRRKSLEHRSDRRAAKNHPRSEGSGKRPAKLIKVQKDELVEDLPWDIKIIDWFKSESAGGVGISLVFHVVLLLALSFVIYSTLDGNEAVSMTLTDSDGLPMELEESVEITTELSGGQLEAFPEMKQVALDEVMQNETAVDIPDILGSGQGNGGGIDDGFNFKMPTGGRVTQKGSFAAWTVPKDPKPGQDYKIVIRIKLSKSARRYRVDDLSGMVIGTDGYRLSIPFDQSSRTKAEKGNRLLPVKRGEYLRIIDQHVQIVVDVPGAASLVKDTIEVQSKRLKEQQKLVIEF